MQLPTREEISPTSGLNLDEQEALEHFYGKTLSEASLIFFEDALYYEGDFKWMGSKGFSFYFPSLEPYLLSVESEGDSDIINAMISTLNLRLKHDPCSIEGCKDAVLRVLSFVSKNWGKFQIDRNIYGDIDREILRLIKKVRALDTF